MKSLILALATRGAHQGNEGERCGGNTGTPWQAGATYGTGRRGSRQLQGFPSDRERLFFPRRRTRHSGEAVS